MSSRAFIVITLLTTILLVIGICILIAGFLINPSSKKKIILF